RTHTRSLSPVPSGSHDGIGPSQHLSGQICPDVIRYAYVALKFSPAKERMEKEMDRARSNNISYTSQNLSVSLPFTHFVLNARRVAFKKLTVDSLPETTIFLDEISVHILKPMIRQFSIFLSLSITPQIAL
ncbi:hypothetical protein PENTCL1PPCAC_21038, partial [Pristionchus entomophagus]